MNTKKVSLAVLSVIIIMMLAGEAMVYVANPYDYSSDVTYGDDGPGYTVESSAAADFRVIQTVHGDMVPISEYYVYCDTRYGSMNAPNDERPAENIIRELALRGVESEIIDADELRQTFLEGRAEGVAVVFTYGSLPSTVYTGDPDDPFFKWFDRGGSAYWFGTTIGRYVATDDGGSHVVQDFERLFFGEGNMSYMLDDRIGSVQTEAADVFCIRAADARFGISASVPGSLEVGYVTEDGFSSASLVPFGSGMLGVVSGVFDNAGRGSFAQLIASGMTYDSRTISVEDVHVRGGSHSGDLSDVPRSHVYIFAGGYYTCHASTHEMD